MERQKVIAGGSHAAQFHSRLPFLPKTINLYITNAKMGKVLTIEEFSNTAWRVICETSVDSNFGFKLNSES